MKVTVEENQAVITTNGLPTIVCDAFKITQLFQNLISNAIKFRRNQAPQIHISADKKGDKWLFSVADNGIGIDKQYKERILKIFQRLHSRDKYPGTGIGLAICKRIVEHHGGELWVESVEGKGSTFYFTIPTLVGKQI